MLSIRMAAMIVKNLPFIILLLDRFVLMFCCL
jgi:hypothetical protein